MGKASRGGGSASNDSLESVRAIRFTLLIWVSLHTRPEGENDTLSGSGRSRLGIRQSGPILSPRPS
ncbi:hypothetical protein EMEDMD4_1280013 [Sinorhizobium medicae]|uniref:Uncharacterized protein n=1 Tax=Sinorhizobium medicae TaxID=110321 RepID=A0A508WUW1_9HYPH|nr:hypothetical protein EMEDMD4_1280013 [Sinorhizobium medicae]